jgi:hypothetical protein
MVGKTIHNPKENWMTKYTYRCVAGPANISVKTERARAQAVKAFEDIMNEQAEHGWEYVGIDEYTTTIPPGCLSVGQTPEMAVLKMLVFRKLADSLAHRVADLA